MSHHQLTYEELVRLLVKDPDVEYDFWLIQTHHEAPLETEIVVLVHGEHKLIWCQHNWRKLVQKQLVDPKWISVGCDI